MNQEVKTCQNCQADFNIEPEDFEFYAKLKVPPPTFCPDCRMQRRLAQYNKFSLHKRKCDLCQKDIISLYQDSSDFPVYDHLCWFSDNWDATDYSLDYDFSVSFFDQYKKLLDQVPHRATINKNSVNCDYCSGALNCKNCYFFFGNGSENSAYSDGFKIMDSYDVIWALNSSQCYEDYNISKCSNIYFSQQVENSHHSSFLFDCRNTNNSFMSCNLRSKDYYFRNEPFSKEEFQKKMSEIDLGSYSNLQEYEKEHEAMIMSHPHKYANIVQSENVSGENIRESKNCHYCFDTGLQLEDCKYAAVAGLNLKDSYDVFDSGTNSELIYECTDVGINSSRIYFSNLVWECLNAEYSTDCFNCQNIFGCYGLKNKKYCILNKQYSKEEYEELLPKIKKQMSETPYVDKKGNQFKYGEFFPIELSPFSYNESLANYKFQIEPEEARKRGYGWADPKTSNQKPTIKSADLPDHIKNVKDSILNEIIECAHKGQCDELCAGVYRVIPSELSFLRDKKIALPRLCPNCRITKKERLKKPYKLWKRQCMCDYKTYKNQTSHKHHAKDRCSNTFQTAYAPERPEIIYCENCYQAEIS